MNTLTPSAASTEPEAFGRDVLAGLRRPRKELPCKYFYDARGSHLFDLICGLEEYYPTRCELEILRRHGRDLAEALGPACALVEYGSGSGLKTRLLLERMARPLTYVPVDISGEHLQRAAAALQARFPDVAVGPVVADFTQPFELPELPRGTRRRAVYFSGSTIGNFPPAEASALLAGMARLCGPGGALVIGVDLRKDPAVIEAAYNDRLGVTAAFNLNLLERINRELDGNFELDAFRHRAFYDSEHGRIEMHLVSRRRQEVLIGAETVQFEEGETIRTEYSYKYAADQFAGLAARGGWHGQRLWTDARGWFSVQYLEC